MRTCVGVHLLENLVDVDFVGLSLADLLLCLLCLCNQRMHQEAHPSTTAASVLCCCTSAFLGCSTAARQALQLATKNSPVVFLAGALAGACGTATGQRINTVHQPERHSMSRMIAAQWFMLPAALKTAICPYVCGLTLSPMGLGAILLFEMWQQREVWDHSYIRQ
jgi:hypothetical protein